MFTQGLRFQEHRVDVQNTQLFWQSGPGALVEETLTEVWRRDDAASRLGAPAACLTSLLWCGTAFVFSKGRGHPPSSLETVKEFIHECCASVGGRLDGWALAQPMPSLARQAETAPRGAKKRKPMSFVFKALVGAKKKPRLEAAGGTAFQSMLREAQLHQDLARQSFAGATFVELIFDGSRFGGVEMELCVAFNMRQNIACFLPPQRMRELGWRKEGAGSSVDEFVSVSELFAARR